MINPIQNNLSFGGIVKVKCVINNGSATSDPKIIDSALRKFNNVLLKRVDNAENAERLSKIREAYHLLDSDYTIPKCKVEGQSRSFLTRIKNKMSYYILSGKDAEKISDSGREIGRTNKILEMNFDSRQGIRSEGQNYAARLDHRELKDEIALRYSLSKDRPSIILYTVSNPKNKKGGVNLSKITFNPNVYAQLKKTKTPKEQFIQTDFMDKLFPKK